MGWDGGLVGGQTGCISTENLFSLGSLCGIKSNGLGVRGSGFYHGFITSEL